MATSIERISLNDSDIKLSINVWRGEPRVDIRHFENGYATKKGGITESSNGGIIL